MKLKDIGKLGLSDKTIAEFNVNPLDLITSDEFSDQNKTNYRVAALDRAFALRVGFRSEFNTLTELFKKIVILKCPHCGKELKVTGGGGNGAELTFNSECSECKISINMSMPVGAIAYHPHEDK